MQQTNSPSQCRFCEPQNGELCRFHANSTESPEDCKLHFDHFIQFTTHEERFRLNSIGFINYSADDASSDDPSERLLGFHTLQRTVERDRRPAWMCDPEMARKVLKGKRSWQQIAIDYFIKQKTLREIANERDSTIDSVYGVIATLRRRAKKFFPNLFSELRENEDGT